MKYALGNMLNGAGGLNADRLSLDLQFATDKTLTARKGPTPVFTRASSGRFVGSDGLIQSAGNNVARFDHDPVTLACKGLLIEESRTNLILQSENLGTTWALTNATASLNVATAPDGSTNADKIINGNGLTLGRAQQSLTLSGSHVYSVFAKAAEWGFVYIAPLQANGGVWFDLTNGTVEAQQAGFVGSITPLGNGWYRCSVQFTGLGTLLTARIHPTNVNNVLTVGDGTSGIFIWGAQLEAGGFPTSYIPTTTASLARSADVCSISGSAFSNLWNTSGGTFLFEGFLIPSTNINLRMLSSGAQRRWLYGNQPGVGTTSETLTLYDGVSTPPYFTNVRIAVKFKIAISVEALACKASFNGSAISTPAHNGNLLNSVTFLGLFENASGFITGVKYYRKNLPNAKLQTLST